MTSNGFDLPTAYLLASMVFIIMPLIAWITLFHEKSAPVAWWCAGSGLTGFGLLALGLRSEFPDLLPFHTSFSLIMMGNSLHLHALLMELRKQSSVWLWISIALFFTLLKDLLYRNSASGDIHFIFGFFALSISFLATGLIARRVAVEESSSDANWLSFINLLGSSIFGLRSILGLLNLTDPDGLRNNGSLGILMVIVIVFIGIINNISIIGLYLERSRHRNMTLIAEEERTRASADLTFEMAAVDRQRSMGELAAGLAHELGQPITGILLNSSVLTEELSNNRSQQHALADVARDITDQAFRARQILEGIRNFIKPHKTSMSIADLPEIINGVRDILAPTWRNQDVRIVLRCTSENPRIRGDLAQLSQVFLNLLRNAFEARRSGIPLVVEIVIRQLGEVHEVVIEDNGVGMSGAQMAMYGAPFITTKDEGMGIGIAISKRIVEHHGGTISVESSSSGHGLRVVLHLPTVDSQWASPV